MPLYATYNLQKDLVKEIEKILGGLTFTDIEGNMVTGCKGYEQSLPIVIEDDREPSEFFPYFIVQMESGETEDDDDYWHVKMAVLLGIYDGDTETNGHQEILKMIDLIQQRFLTRPLLNKKFRCLPKMSWALQEESTYPFYFGGLEMTFGCMKIGREDD